MCERHLESKREHSLHIAVRLRTRADSYLSEFPRDGDGPADAIMPHKESFEGPAPEMEHGKDIQGWPNAGQVHVRAVLCIQLRKNTKRMINISNRMFHDLVGKLTTMSHLIWDRMQCILLLSRRVMQSSSSLDPEWPLAYALMIGKAFASQTSKHMPQGTFGQLQAHIPRGRNGGLLATTWYGKKEVWVSNARDQVWTWTISYTVFHFP